MLLSCANSQKQIAHATRMHPSWVSRQCGGEHTGAVQRFYALLADLTTSRKTDPAHLIAGGIVVIREALGALPSEELVSRIHEVITTKSWAQAEEYRLNVAVCADLGTRREAETMRAWERACLRLASLALTAALLARAKVER